MANNQQLGVGGRSAPSLDDPAVQDLLQLKTFEDSFHIEDFISTLSEKLISNSSAEAGPLNPVPFIHTFSNSLDVLLKIRKDVQSKTEKLENDVRRAEREYGKRLTELDKGFEAVGSSFSTLESRITSVGRTAIRIGEQLESLHLSRQKAQISSQLLSYLLVPSAIEDALALGKKEGREGRENRMKLAVILRRLGAIVRESEVKEGTKEIIEGYCERFEKEVLGMFDRWYRKGDPKMMAHCAKVLLEFNGGASCIQIYVNQHDFFISKERIAEVQQVEEGDLWDALPDPSAPTPRSEKSLSNLFEEIRVTVSQEAQIIQAVFPTPPVVMQVFLQRVFAQVIQQNIERLILQSSSLSTLSTLRILHLSHTLTASLVEDLKAYDFSSLISTSRSNSIGDASMSILNEDRRIGGGSGTLVAQTLDIAMEELFAGYLEGQRYMERETKSLGELYAVELLPFTRYHETINKAKPNSIFNKVVNQISAASSVSGTTQAATSALLKYAGVGDYGKNPINGEDLKVIAADGDLSLETAEKMLRWHAEAVGRCVELSLGSDVQKNAFSLLRILAETLGRSYIEIALDSAILKLDSHDPKNEPILSPLALIKAVDLVSHLWQRYVTTALLPLASPSVTIRREMVVFNNHSVVRIEEKVNQIVQKTTDLFIPWLTFLLAKQKKNDFKPRNDDISFERVNTEPCLACCDALDKIKDVAKDSLSGKNGEIFLTEIGVAFHSLLLEHLKKFPVSAAGGLMLTKDLAMYQDSIATFQIPALSERFEMIRQLGNLFIVQPEVLKTYMRENYLGRIDTRLLRPYLAQRSDYSTFSKRFVEEEGFGHDSDLNAGIGGRMVDAKATAVNLTKLGLGRLGRMMNEFENNGEKRNSIAGLDSKEQSRSSTPVPTPNRQTSTPLNYFAVGMH